MMNANIGPKPTPKPHVIAAANPHQPMAVLPGKSLQELSNLASNLVATQGGFLQPIPQMTPAIAPPVSIDPQVGNGKRKHADDETKHKSKHKSKPKDKSASKGVKKRKANALQWGGTPPNAPMLIAPANGQAGPTLSMTPGRPQVITHGPRLVVPAHRVTVATATGPGSGATPTTVTTVLGRDIPVPKELPPLQSFECKCKVMRGFCGMDCTKRDDRDRFRIEVYKCDEKSDEALLLHADAPHRVVKSTGLLDVCLDCITIGKNGDKFSLKLIPKVQGKGRSQLKLVTAKGEDLVGDMSIKNDHRMIHGFIDSEKHGMLRKNFDAVPTEPVLFTWRIQWRQSK